MEVAQRVRVLNDRFSIIQELLDILRVHVQVRPLPCTALVAGWASCRLWGDSRSAGGVGLASPHRQHRAAPAAAFHSVPTRACVKLKRAQDAGGLAGWCSVAVPVSRLLPPVQKSYYSQLETAVMWLVGVCAVVGVGQLVALAFWTRPEA
jgi:hypothetical protein